VTGPCPDWRALTAHRLDPVADTGDAAQEPAGWDEALAHLDGCPACRRAALTADPTLLFRRLPALPAPFLDLSPAAEAAEVEAVRLAVASMRTARRLAPAREPASRRYRQWGAAAVLAGAAVSLGSAPGLPAAGSHAAAVAPVPHTVRLPAPPPGLRLVADRVPMVELNRPAARVYEMDGGENLSVVMIVDERLDV